MVILETERRLSEDPIAQVIRLDKDFTILAKYVALRESDLAEKANKCFLGLASRLLSERPVLGFNRIQEIFKETCQKDLRAEGFLCIDGSDSTGGTPKAGQKPVVLREIFSGQSQFIFNRPAHNHSYDRLNEILRLTEFHAIAALASPPDEFRIYCAVYRPVRSRADYWNAHDMHFLNLSLSFFQLFLKRRSDFDTMLETIRAPQEQMDDESPFSQAQFNLVYRLCRAYFNVDQILLTRVTREHESYHIKGVFAFGFDEKDVWLRGETNRRFDPKTYTDRPKLDVMPHILRNYLDPKRNATKSPPYCGEVGGPPNDFTIDEEVIRECKLRGKIYFLPRVAADSNGVIRLRSILHLGRADGKLELSQKAPFLLEVAQAVAEGLKISLARRPRGRVLRSKPV